MSDSLLDSSYWVKNYRGLTVFSAQNSKMLIYYSVIIVHNANLHVYMLLLLLTALLSSSQRQKRHETFKAWVSRRAPRDHSIGRTVMPLLSLCQLHTISLLPAHCSFHTCLTVRLYGRWYTANNRGTVSSLSTCHIPPSCCSTINLLNGLSFLYDCNPYSLPVYFFHSAELPEVPRTCNALSCLHIK